MEGVHVLMPVRHFAYHKQLPPKPSISIGNITANTFTRPLKWLNSYFPIKFQPWYRFYKKKALFLNLWEKALTAVLRKEEDIGVKISLLLALALVAWLKNIFHNHLTENKWTCFTSNRLPPPLLLTLLCWQLRFIFPAIRVEQEWWEATEGHWSRGRRQGPVPATKEDPGPHQARTPGTVRVSQI